MSKLDKFEKLDDVIAELQTLRKKYGNRPVGVAGYRFDGKEDELVDVGSYIDIECVSYEGKRYISLASHDYRH